MKADARINEIREAVIGNCTYPSSLASGDRNVNGDYNAVLALALVYLGDCIREGTSDIGPAINKLADELRLK